MLKRIACGGVVVVTASGIAGEAGEVVGACGVELGTGVCDSVGGVGSAVAILVPVLVILLLVVALPLVLRVVVIPVLASVPAPG